jgi:hypothetical protein
MAEYPTGPRRSHSVENAEEFDSARSESLSVPCPFCHAQVGQPCRNDASGRLLEHFPAHPVRTTAARKAAS